MNPRKVHKANFKQQKFLSLKISRGMRGSFALSVTRMEVEHGQFWRPFTPRIKEPIFCITLGGS